jgi:colicin import membrane protein
MPVVLTLALHLVVAGLLMVRWANPVTIEARTSAPVAIKATLVSADTLKPKPKPKPQATTEPVPAAVTPEQKVEPDVPLEAAKPERTPEQLSQETLSDIESVLASEQLSQKGSVGTVSDQVAALIKQAVIGRWTRPPSARNNMVAILEIALVPTGDVVGVTVLESSGNVAFDSSAVNAIEKVARFSEVKSLERAVFERDFRRFQLIFRPEDLRY